MLKIFNTLKKEKEGFCPQNPGEVKIYTCGVTVYDDCHIGHGRSLYIFEVIRRYLEYKGFKVRFVRNITDVDDKIINKAKEYVKEDRVSIFEAFNKVRTTYIDSYYQDLKLLGIPPANFEPKATEHILDMIDFIKELIDKEFAYVREGNVYFRVRRFTSYGKLSGKNIEELLNAVRIEPDPYKEDPLDFALWKRRKEDEPYWNSPFGEGRPGWHIECSTMARKFLGETLDIHGGGKDLVFPHHENEIAQSEALTEKPFSLYWIHHGLITIKGEKMAKSLGNFFTLKEIFKDHHNEVLKLFYLSSHYASPLDFSLDKLSEYRRQRERLYIVYDWFRDVRIEPLKNEKVIKLQKEFEEAMDDDFNFSLAKSVLLSFPSIVASLDKKSSVSGEFKNLFFTIGKIFCLFEEESFLLDDEFKRYIERKIEERKKLRKEKKYEEADRIREELIEKGIVLEDLTDGSTRWRIKR
jgi:cysteinyl-tRNA synthetase